MKKRRLNRGELDSFRQGRAQKAPGKRTASEQRYRKAELAEEVPQQQEQKPAAAKRDATKTEPARPADAQAAAPAVADPQQADQGPEIDPAEKEIAPSFLPAFDPEPDAEKDPAG